MKYVAVGTGRCGTGYLAQVLASAGVKCGHEAVFGLKYNNKAAEHYDADSSWLALPYLEAGKEPGAQVVHLVRDPWDIFRGWFFDFKSLFSVWNERKGNRYDNFIYRHCPKLCGKSSPVLRALYYYVDWTMRIESLNRSVLTWKVEDNPSIPLGMLGIFPSGQLYANTKYNSRCKNSLTVEETDCLLRSHPKAYDAMLKCAERYGYERP